MSKQVKIAIECPKCSYQYTGDFSEPFGVNMNRTVKWLWKTESILQNAPHVVTNSICLWQ